MGCDKNNYIKLWLEFSESKTGTSRLIHLIDKLEMAIQANYYLENNKNIKKNDVKPFFESALRYVVDNSNTKKIRSFSNNDNKNKILMK